MNWTQKLYAFLHGTNAPQPLLEILFTPAQLDQLRKDPTTSTLTLASHIASSSDRINLPQCPNPSTPTEIRHPISGKSQAADPFIKTDDLRQIQTAIEQIQNTIAQDSSIADEDKDTEIAKQHFWWFWRFYPELLAKQQPNTNVLLFPAHPILPDCPWHSYASTVSALTGALTADTRPYLLCFTFSPIQEFIKASRKFVDFWAGSYLLHYLSAKLCWHIAQQYGPDSIIVPSLWSQEIIDALMIQTFDRNNSKVFSNSFRTIQGNSTPVDRFNDRTSTSLSTAGFPNIITALIPGEQNAQNLGQDLTKILQDEWRTLANTVKSDIRDRVISTLTNLHRSDRTWEKLLGEKEFNLAEREDPEPYKRDLEKWQQKSNWTWNQLWQEQIDNTWEPYWTAVPLGHPAHSLEQHHPDPTWKQAQNQLWQIFPNEFAQIDLPSEFEEQIYQQFNVGTWWGTIQQSLRNCIQVVKNNRTWKIPTAPGSRSTISGQFSAVHPSLNYTIIRVNGEARDLREGGGLPAGSMRLFWFIMSKAYPGLMNGSEQLNALELTKRMSWIYGEQAICKTLGITQLDPQDQDIDYEALIRFPNLTSIASARLAKENPELMQLYWKMLEKSVLEKLIKPLQGKSQENSESARQYRNKFYAKTQRPLQIAPADAAISAHPKTRGSLNGVMFSSKWLAEDMGLMNGNINQLRHLIDQAHKETGFGEGSPSDWWAIVLADGDSMGQYISGQKLEKYDRYVVQNLVDTSQLDRNAYQSFLSETPKRMGPATHVGLNRALLDFSNRIVPYLTEKRFCGRVIYSGGDDVMVVLPLEDVPGFVRSLRAAWGAHSDPYGDFENQGDYWNPTKDLDGISRRPHFTMGKGATMSMGIVFAYKTVPLPTVLETLWDAEAQAKSLPNKDGLCFRVIYGGGNQLEAMMKGHLLDDWWNLIHDAPDTLSPVLYRLSEELPKRAQVTQSDRLFSQAAKVIMQSRDETLDHFEQLHKWLDCWECWVNTVPDPKSLGCDPKDLGNLLRFSAFWVDKMSQRRTWGELKQEGTP